VSLNIEIGSSINFYFPIVLPSTPKEVATVSAEILVSDKLEALTLVIE
jgi:hypothetical protein